MPNLALEVDSFRWISEEILFAAYSHLNQDAKVPSKMIIKEEMLKKNLISDSSLALIK